MPKEARIQKLESASSVAEPRADAIGLWTWEEADHSSQWVLHDGDSGASPEPMALLERTSRFGEDIIRFIKRVPRGRDHPENNRLVDPLVGCATSVGANYCEADDAVSGKDYRNKIGTCRKESKEAMFFLRMMAASEQTLAKEARDLWREAKELNLIFGSIWRKKR